MTYVEPADLRHRMVLSKPLATPDGQGGIEPGFEAITELWAAIAVIDAETTERAGHSLWMRRHRITIRHRSDIRPGWRLERAGTMYAVTTLIDPDGAGRWLELETETIT